jgi:hypothetical protein
MDTKYMQDGNSKQLPLDVYLPSHYFFGLTFVHVLVGLQREPFYAVLSLSLPGRM